MVKSSLAQRGPCVPPHTEALGNVSNGWKSSLLALGGCLSSLGWSQSGSRDTLPSAHLLLPDHPYPLHSSCCWSPSYEEPPCQHEAGLGIQYCLRVPRATLTTLLNDHSGTILITDIPTGVLFPMYCQMSEPFSQESAPWQQEQEHHAV